MTNFNTPQDFYNFLTESTKAYFAAIPKNEKEIKDALQKVKAVLDEETKNSKEMWATYSKAAKGDATANEIAVANKIAGQLLVSTRFATLLAVPGAVFVLPALVKFAKEYGINLVPESVAKQFAI